MFESAGWILFGLCIFVLVQGAIQNGMVSSSINAIEASFSLSSQLSGSIASVYDAFFVLGVIPAGFFGVRGNCPKWLAGGAWIFGFGVILVGLSVPFHPPNSGAAMAIICIGQAIAGIGSSALFVIGPVYLAENSTQRALPLYYGIFYGTSAIAAVVGFVLGGVFSARWVWWGGFILMGVVSLLIGIFLFFLPRELPREQVEAQGDENNTEKDEKILPYFGKAENFEGRSPREIWSIWITTLISLAKNPTFILNSIAMTSKVFSISAFIVFLPKFAIASFQLPPLTAALYIAGTAVPGAAFGMFFGGYLVRRLNASTKKAMLICLISAIFPPLLSWIFLSASPTVFFILLIPLQFSSFMVESPLPTILMRIVKPEERGLAVGIFNLFSRLVGALPGPIVLGTLIDETCTNDPCTQYDAIKLRKLFFSMSISMLLISLALLLAQYLVWSYHLKRVKTQQGQGSEPQRLTDGNQDQELTEVKKEEDDTGTSNLDL